MGTWERKTVIAGEGGLFTGQRLKDDEAKQTVLRVFQKVKLYFESF